MKTETLKKLNSEIEKRNFQSALNAIYISLVSIFGILIYISFVVLPEINPISEIRIFGF